MSPQRTDTRPTGRLIVIAVALLVAPYAVTPVHGQESDDATPARLHVTGSASVSVPPDRATLVLGVETQADSAEAASAENNRAMERVIAALREHGIPDERMRTRRLSLRPSYRRGPGDGPVIDGYQASNHVTVEVDDVEAVGEVMDVAVRAGANQVQGAYMGLEDSEAAYQEALTLATARARAKAEAMASALGVELGPMIDVIEGGARPLSRGIENLPVPGAIQLRGTSVSAPVSPGDVDVRATVQITWRLIR